MKKTLLFILFFPLFPLTEGAISYPFIISNIVPTKNYHQIIFSIVTATIVAVVMNYLNGKFRIHASRKFLLMPAIISILFALLFSLHPDSSANLTFHAIFEIIIYMLLVNNQFLKTKVDGII